MTHLSRTFSLYRSTLFVAGFLVAVPAVGRAQGGGAPALGPKDAAVFPPLDTGRVGIGTPAPDFTLETKDGGTITLSQFRGKKNIVLVFYRGHW